MTRLSSIVNSHPNFQFYTPNQQINYLFYNEYLPTSILDIAAKMLSNLFELRHKLLITKEGTWCSMLIRPLTLRLSRILPS